MAAQPIITLTVSQVAMTFAAGLIATVTVTYSISGGGPETWSGQHTWNLTPAEQASAAATGFVAALVAKLVAVTGLTVVTT